MTRSARLPRRAVIAVVALGTVAALVAGCSSGKSSNGGSKSTSTGAAPASLRTIAVTITTDGCAAQHASYNAGPLTFQVSNKNATAVSEIEVLSEDRILGEQENMPPGFNGSFSINLQPGSYTLYCPGAATEKAALKITGTGTSAPNTDTHAQLLAGAEEYKDYVVAQITQLVTSVATLNTAIKAGNLTAAQNAYIKARPYYERIEPVAESFPKLDPAIDAKIIDVSSVKDWTGFHPIEKRLFQQKKVSGLTALSAGLVSSVNRLQSLVTGLSGFQPTELANGAVGLLQEAAKNKITGIEEAYSHIDLVDLSANLEGSQQAFAFLQDGLQKIDPSLVATIKTAFADALAVLDEFKDAANPSGFRSYPQLSQADTRKIAQALQSVFEPLSRVSGKIVGA